MALRDGGIAGGIFLGIVFIAAGAGMAYCVLSTPGQNPQSAWFSLLFDAAGIAVALYKSSTSVTIDKVPGTIMFVRKRLAGTSVKTYAVADALRVELRHATRYVSDGAHQGFAAGGHEVFESQAVLVFKDGTEMPLENQKSRGGMGVNINGISLNPSVLMAGEGQDLATSRRVADFLGVPFQEPRANNDIGEIPL